MLFGFILYRSIDLSFVLVYWHEELLSVPRRLNIKQYNYYFFKLESQFHRLNTCINYNDIIDII